jgi:hypothetical protein
MAVAWLGCAIEPCNTLKDFNQVMGKFIWSASVVVKIQMGCGSCQGAMNTCSVLHCLVYKVLNTCVVR